MRRYFRFSSLMVLTMIMILALHTTVLAQTVTPIGSGIADSPFIYLGSQPQGITQGTTGTLSYGSSPTGTTTSGTNVSVSSPSYGPNAVFLSTGLSRYFVPLFISGSKGTLPQGINDKGSMSGSFYNSDGYLHAFRYKLNFGNGADLNTTIRVVESNYNTINLANPPCAHVQFFFPDYLANVSLGIDLNDEIAGYYIDPTGITHGWIIDNYFYCYPTLDVSGAKVTTYTGINIAQQIIGYYTGPYGLDYGVNGILIISNRSNFTTMETSLIYPGAFRTFPSGISNPSNINVLGQVVGYYNEPQHPDIAHGFLLSGASIIPDGYGNINLFGGSYTTIDFPGARDTFPSGINDAGQIVGYYTFASEANTGYPAHGYLQTGNSFVTIDMKNYVSPGADNTLLNGINNNGQMVGYYNNSQGADNQDFLISNMVDAVDLQDDIASQNYSSLAQNGNAVSGVAADGVAQILIRIPVQSQGDNVSFTLLNDYSAQSGDTDADGGIFPVGGACCLSAVNTQAANTLTATTPAYAFVMYRAPRDFARPNRSGDNAASYRAVRLKIQINQNNPTNLVVK